MTNKILSIKEQLAIVEQYELNVSKIHIAQEILGELENREEELVLTDEQFEQTTDIAYWLWCKLDEVSCYQVAVACVSAIANTGYEKFIQLDKWSLANYIQY